MNPQQVTTSQLLGSLTATHWVATVAVIFTGISSIAGGSFWLGQKLATSESLAQLAELKGSIGQLQTRLETYQARTDALKQENLQLIDANQKLQDERNQINREMARTTSQLERANNCTFIHEQIKATRAEMESTGGAFVFDASKVWEEKQKARKATLEKRLEGYQLQLGGCNKPGG